MTRFLQLKVAAHNSKLGCGSLLFIGLLYLRLTAGIKLLQSFLNVILRTDLSHLLSFSFCFIKWVKVCFDLSTKAFYLYLNLCLAREFTYCHFRNSLRLPLSDVSFS